MSSKECDLVRAVFLYVARAIAEGDLAALQRMRLNYDDVQLFSTLRLDDLQRLAENQPHGQFVDISWRPSDLQTLVRWAVQTRDDAELRQALIQAGASREMMAHWYAMGHDEFAAYQAMLSAPYPGGRPPKPDEATHQQVWQAWQQLMHAQAYDEATPEQYLALYKSTGVPLRIVWSLAKQWQGSDSVVVAFPGGNDAQRTIRRDHE